MQARTAGQARPLQSRSAGPLQLTALLRQGLRAARCDWSGRLLQARRLIHRRRSGGTAGCGRTGRYADLSRRASGLARPRRNAGLLRTLLLPARLPVELCGLTRLRRLDGLLRRARHWRLLALAAGRARLLLPRPTRLA